MPSGLDELEVAFCDEDTAVWTAAARELGKRAIAEPRAHAWLKTWLAAAPAKGKEEQSESNIHRFRHACCGLASYLSQPNPDLSAFEASIREEIVGPLVYISFLGLPEPASILDLAPLGLSAEFDAWKSAQIEKRKKEIAKFGSGGSEKALAANQQKL